MFLIKIICEKISIFSLNTNCRLELDLLCIFVKKTSDTRPNVSAKQKNRFICGIF